MSSPCRLLSKINALTRASQLEKKSRQAGLLALGIALHWQANVNTSYAGFNRMMIIITRVRTSLRHPLISWKVHYGYPLVVSYVWKILDVVFKASFEENFSDLSQFVYCYQGRNLWTRQSIRLSTSRTLCYSTWPWTYGYITNLSLQNQNIASFLRDTHFAHSEWRHTMYTQA